MEGLYDNPKFFMGSKNLHILSIYGTGCNFNFKDNDALIKISVEGKEDEQYWSKEYIDEQGYASFDTLNFEINDSIGKIIKVEVESENNQDCFKKLLIKLDDIVISLRELNQ